MKAFIKRNWAEFLRVTTFIMVAFLLIFALSAYINGQKVQNHFLKQTDQNTQEIETQAKEIKQLTQEVKDDTGKITTQINCVLNFFSQPPPERNSSAITMPNPCIITPTSAPVGSATGGTKSV